MVAAGPARRARRAAGALVAVLVLAATAAPAAAQTPEETFAAANGAYEEGRYAEAAQGYRSLLRYDIHDPRLEYNLGNAEFRLGNLGAAILHYERARLLDPTDRSVLDNLAFARTLCFDRVETGTLPPPLSWIRSAQDALGPDRQAWAALLLVWLAAALVARASARPGGWGAGAGWSVAGVTLLAGLTAASWYVTWQRLEGTQLAVVLADSAEVLAGPAENNASLTVVHEGLTLEVRAARPEWVQVALPNGLNGWIPRGALGLV